MLNRAKVAYAKSWKDKEGLIGRKEKTYESQVRYIEKLIMDNAKHHVNETRVVAKGLHEDVGTFFKKKGFIVWENSEVLVIKIY